MIDVQTEVEAKFFYRWISVKKLKQILDELDNEDILTPNRVGNLSVIRKDNYIGYIDFHSEEFDENL